MVNNLPNYLAKLSNLEKLDFCIFALTSLDEHNDDIIPLHDMKRIVQNALKCIINNKMLDEADQIKLNLVISHELRSETSLNQTARHRAYLFYWISSIVSILLSIGISAYKSDNSLASTEYWFKTIKSKTSEQIENEYIAYISDKLYKIMEG